MYEVIYTYDGGKDDGGAAHHLGGVSGMMSGTDGMREDGKEW